MRLIHLDFEVVLDGRNSVFSYSCFEPDSCVPNLPVFSQMSVLIAVCCKALTINKTSKTSLQKEEKLNGL